LPRPPGRPHRRQTSHPPRQVTHPRPPQSRRLKQPIRPPRRGQRPPPRRPPLRHHPPHLRLRHLLTQHLSRRLLPPSRRQRRITPARRQARPQIRPKATTRQITNPPGIVRRRPERAVPATVQALHESMRQHRSPRRCRTLRDGPLSAAEQRRWGRRNNVGGALPNRAAIELEGQAVRRIDRALIGALDPDSAGVVDPG
jgi:hypothetical protein